MKYRLLFNEFRIFTDNGVFKVYEKSVKTNIIIDNMYFICIILINTIEMNIININYNEYKHSLYVRIY